MIWLWWWFLLVAQQGSQTFVSRARNGDSLVLHAIAAVCSNGVWIVGQFLIIDQWVKSNGNPAMLAATIAYYILFCVAGSVGAHALMLRKRKGADASA